MFNKLRESQGNFCGGVRGFGRPLTVSTGTQMWCCSIWPHRHIHWNQQLIYRSPI